MGGLFGSIAHYIRKILLVSDNDAFNRLYEFIGQQDLNQSLRQKGYLDKRIVHRLETALSKSQNQWTNPLRFVNGDNDNEYEYDETALPFLKNLGQAIYEVELNRPREFKPDLSRFQFTERD